MINEQIEKIQLLLETSETMRPETRAELLRLLAGLKQELEENPEPAQTSDAAGDQSSFDHTLEGLRGSVADLETSHPEVVSMVNRLATTLSNMGI